MRILLQYQINSQKSRSLIYLTYNVIKRLAVNKCDECIANKIKNDLFLSL